uniref:Porin n=1 Tax=Caulobacter sp. (strain K31) TaxID=366602 RepID=B0T7P8_CAUSK
MSPSSRAPSNKGDVSMTRSTTKTPLRRTALGGAALAGLLGLAFAVDPAAAQTAAQASPSDSLAINLTRLLVKQGVITQTAADDLIAQATRETEAARSAPAAAGPALPPPAAGSTRITYVPEIVKNQIRDEIRQEVIQQARNENWATPNAVPEWSQRITLSGDLRFRNQADLYDDGNIRFLPDFAALNANGPIDTNSNDQVFPWLNTIHDRSSQLSIRGRINLDAKISDSVAAHIRLASGRNNSPVSTTQALGGGLTKKDIWLDRAYVELKPRRWVRGLFGRMPNPFVDDIDGVKLSDLVYDTDLNLDGAAATVNYPIWPEHGLRLRAAAGAFLLDYRDTNFPATSLEKAPTKTKWMFGGQATLDWDLERVDWRVSAGFYQFQYDRGLLSAPCPIYLGINYCSTDFTRPAFMQKGNTVFYIRNIADDPTNKNAAPQYVGLTFDYDVLDLSSSLDVRLANDRHLLVVGNYARNLAYKKSDLCRYGQLGAPQNFSETTPANNPDGIVCNPPEGVEPARLVTGPNAYMGKVTYGHLNPYRWGEWNLGAGYKRLETDAVIDGYTDSDFHLGGTNAKGYFVNASIGLFEGANLEFRWFSANEVSGPPLSIDVGQIDLNVRF